MKVIVAIAALSTIYPLLVWSRQPATAEVIVETPAEAPFHAGPPRDRDAPGSKRELEFANRVAALPPEENGFPVVDVKDFRYDSNLSVRGLLGVPLGTAVEIVGRWEMRRKMVSRGFVILDVEGREIPEKDQPEFWQVEGYKEILGREPQDGELWRAVVYEGGTFSGLPSRGAFYRDGIDIPFRQGDFGFGFRSRLHILDSKIEIMSGTD